MDHSTLERHLEGDPDASRIVERTLRIYAAAMLEDPAFRMNDAASRGVLVRASAAEALKSGGRTEDQLLTRVVRTAALYGVEHLRTQDPIEGAGHLPPAFLASYAVAPQVIAGPALEAAEQHLATCIACAAQARLVRDVCLRAVQAARAEEAGGSFEALPVARESGSVTEVVAHRVGERRPAGIRTQARAASLSEVFLPRLAWAGIVLLLVAIPVAILALSGRRGTTGPAAVDSTLPGLAQVWVPELPPASERAPSHVRAFQDLEADRCALAGTRMRKVRRENPFDIEAWYWEGLAFLCAGQGRAAAEALSGVARSPQAVLFPDLDFYRGQAALLEGDRSSARAALETNCASQTALSYTACEQVARLR